MVKSGLGVPHTVIMIATTTTTALATAYHNKQPASPTPPRTIMAGVLTTPYSRLIMKSLHSETRSQKAIPDDYVSRKDLCGITLLPPQEQQPNTIQTIIET